MPIIFLIIIQLCSSYWWFVLGLPIHKHLSDLCCDIKHAFSHLMNFYLILCPEDKISESVDCQHNWWVYTGLIRTTFTCILRYMYYDIQIELFYWGFKSHVKAMLCPIAMAYDFCVLNISFYVSKTTFVIISRCL